MKKVEAGNTDTTTRSVIVICDNPGYEESGESHPCFICGHEYDMGSGYFFMPCPRCGHDPEDWPFKRVILTLSKRLRTSQGKVRKMISLKMGVSEETIKRWQYRGMDKRKIEDALSSFKLAVREILEERGI